MTRQKIVHSPATSSRAASRARGGGGNHVFRKNRRNGWCQEPRGKFRGEGWGQGPRPANGGRGDNRGEGSDHAPRGGRPKGIRHPPAPPWLRAPFTHTP